MTTKLYEHKPNIYSETIYYDPKVIDAFLDDPSQHAMALSREFYSNLNVIETTFSEVPELAAKCLVAKRAYESGLRRAQLPLWSPKRWIVEASMIGHELKDARPEILYEVIGNCITSLEQTVDMLIPAATLSLTQTRAAKEYLFDCSGKANRYLLCIGEEEQRKREGLHCIGKTEIGTSADFYMHEKQLMLKQTELRDISDKKKRILFNIAARKQKLEKIKPLEDVQEQIINVMIQVRDSVGMSYEWLEQSRLGYTISDHIVRYGKGYGKALNAIRSTSDTLDAVPDAARDVLANLRKLLR